MLFGREQFAVKTEMSGEVIDKLYAKELVPTPIEEFEKLPEDEKKLRKPYPFNQRTYEAAPGIICDQDVAVPMHDGVILYADIFRPADSTAKVPVILAWSNYGKRPNEYRPDELNAYTPGVPKGSISDLAKFEAADPEFWVPSGYVVANVGIRGIGYWADKIPDFSKVVVPAYVTAGWNHFHLRGSVNGWRKIASEQKWLRAHREFEWPDFYSSTYLPELKMFFDRYCKGIRNGWESTPRVRIEVQDRFDITVKELSERCAIARTTFYRFFEDTYDLLERLEQYLLGELVLYRPLMNGSTTGLQSSGVAGKPYESIRHFFGMGIYLRKLLQPIMSENGDPYFKDRLARRLREELGAMMSDEGVPNDELRSYYVAAIAASYIGLLAHAATTNREDSLGIDQIVFIANSMRVAYFRSSNSAPAISDRQLFGNSKSSI